MSAYIPRMLTPKRIARLERMVELLSQRPMSRQELAAEFRCKIETIRGDLQLYDGILFREVKARTRGGNARGSDAGLYGVLRADIDASAVRRIVAPGFADWWPVADRELEQAMRSMVLA